MHYKNEHETVAIQAKGHEITEVRYGLRVVWQSVRSCFGKGFWIDEKPWINDDAWKNNY